MNKFLLCVLFLLMGCAPLDQTSTRKEQARAETNLNALVQNQPPPDLGGFSFEKYLANKLILLRNKEVKTTYTYQFVPNAKGVFVIYICQSIGYPIPYAVQVTNPQRIELVNVGGKYEAVVVSNPEPNGLNMPSSADATWIPCVIDGMIYPFYYEEKVSSFSQELENPDMVLKFKKPSYKGISIEDYTKEVKPTPEPKK